MLQCQTLVVIKSTVIHGFTQDVTLPVCKTMVLQDSCIKNCDFVVKTQASQMLEAIKVVGCDFYGVMRFDLVWWVIQSQSDRFTALRRLEFEGQCECENVIQLCKEWQSGRFGKLKEVILKQKGVFFEVASFKKETAGVVEITEEGNVDCHASSLRKIVGQVLSDPEGEDERP